MLAIALFIAVCLALMAGYPVALTLAGVSLLFAGISALAGHFDIAFLGALPNRLYGIIGNTTLIAVPLFVFMGVALERSRLAEGLLQEICVLCSRLRGGLAIAVVIVGTLLAASTGIVGAAVVTMGLLSLPVMLQNRYHPALAAGTVCATGTLGQVIPPSIALVLLGDVLSGAYQQAQLGQGIFAPKTVSVGDLFVGALLPGLLLASLYILYIMVRTYLHPNIAPQVDAGHLSLRRLLLNLLPPLLLITVVLGSILAGAATPTEAAGIGALGALLLAAGKRRVDMDMLRTTARSTLEITSMVFLILIGATVFSLVFRGLGGDELVQEIFRDLPGGTGTAIVLVMGMIFLLGFILDFIEITFVVVPIVGPVLLAMGIDPIWLGVIIAVNLQTSFLTPPFGFALFYLRGVAPASVSTMDIYRGVVPFITIQLLVLLVLILWPPLATWLPELLR